VSKEMPEGVIRQRRNFLLFSLIVCGFLFLDLKITDISIFGIKVKISNSENIFWIIVFFWLYFFWRFYQYARAVTDLGVKAKFRHYYHTNSRLYFSKEAIKKHPNFINPEIICRGDLKLIGRFKLVYEDTSGYSSSGELKQPYSEGPIEFNRLRLILPWIKSWASVCTRESCFSDYILPYLVGIIVLIYIVLSIINLT
jgi:hypothetical protein